MNRRLGRAACAAIAAMWAAQATDASFHLMQIEQVIGGVEGDTSAQAIQLRTRDVGQNLVQQARLRVVDAQGLNPVTVINLNAAVPNGAAGARILIATPSFLSSLDGPLAANFMMTSPIPPSYMAAGSLTFESDGGIVYWRLSWGGAAYTGPNNGDILNDPNGNFGPPFAGPLPSGTLQALRFQGPFNAQSNSNATDYALTPGASTWTNNAGASATLVPSIVDCNGNGIDDDDDIANGASYDADANGVPDECQANVTVEQISWRDDQGGFAQQFSDFGVITVTAIEPPEGAIAWLNAVVGTTWIVRNAPIVSVGHPGSAHRYALRFDLGNVPGVPVLLVNLGSSLTVDQLVLPPMGKLLPTSVLESAQHLGVDYDGKDAPGQPFVPEGPVNFDNPADADPKWETVMRRDVEDLQEDNNHCAPGSGARCLSWMNDLYCLGFPEECDTAEEIYDMLRDMDHMMTSAATGTRVAKIVSGLEQLIEDKGLEDQLQVDNDVDATPAEVFEAIKAGKDVLGRALLNDGRNQWGHRFIIIGVTKCGDEYTIHYRDDEEQGDDGDGDDGTKSSQFTRDGTMLSDFGAAATWGGMITVCPTRLVQLDAAEKWLNGDEGSGGTTEGLIPLLDRLLEGEKPTNEDLENLSTFACNLVDTACGLLTQLQASGAAANAVTEAENLKNQANEAKGSILLYVLLGKDPAFLQDARDAIDGAQGKLDKIRETIDCNDNEVDDLRDIENGTSPDVNDNNIPDECECLTDVNGDGQTNVQDLTAVILAWGEAGGVEDVNGDGVVSVADLTAIVLAWGPC